MNDFHESLPVKYYNTIDRPLLFFDRPLLPRNVVPRSIAPSGAPKIQARLGAKFRYAYDSARASEANREGEAESTWLSSVRVSFDGFCAEVAHRIWYKAHIKIKPLNN
jgi:hypothetical protein